MLANKNSRPSWLAISGSFVFRIPRQLSQQRELHVGCARGAAGPDQHPGPGAGATQGRHVLLRLIRRVHRYIRFKSPIPQWFFVKPCTPQHAAFFPSVLNPQSPQCTACPYCTEAPTGGSRFVRTNKTKQKSSNNRILN